jgi:hypothetical protein
MKVGNALTDDVVHCDEGSRRAETFLHRAREGACVLEEWLHELVGEIGERIVVSARNEQGMSREQGSVIQEGERDFVFEHNGNRGFTPHYVAEHAHEHGDYRGRHERAVVQRAGERGYSVERPAGAGDFGGSRRVRMNDSTVREHAEAHGHAIAAGDLAGAASDLTEAARAKAPAVMKLLPRPVTAAEVTSVELAADAFVVRTSYTGDGGAAIVEAKWVEIDGRPRIVDIEVVS